MSWQNIAAGLAIVGATYVAATNVSNALFNTNFATIGYQGPGDTSGGSNSDANLGDALSGVDAITGGPNMSMDPGSADTISAASGAGASSAPVNTAAGATASNNPQANINQAAQTAQAQTAAGAAPPSAASTGTNTAAATPAGAPQPQSMVSQVGGGLLNFAKSAGGGALLGNVVQGIAAGKQSEAALAEKHRLEGAFTPTQFSSILSGVNTPVPTGYLDRARRVGQFLSGGAQPTVGAPAAVPTATPPIPRVGG